MNLHLLTVYVQHIRLWITSSWYIMFVDDIAVQKGKLFGIIWLLNCTSDEADEVHVHKRLFYGIINGDSLLIF